MGPTPGGRVVKLPGGHSAAEVVVLLEAFRDVPLLRLEHARGLLCGLGLGVLELYVRHTLLCMNSMYDACTHSSLGVAFLWVGRFHNVQLPTP